MGDPMADDFLSYMVYFFKALFLKTLKFQVCRHFSLRLIDEFSWDKKQIVHNLCNYGPKSCNFKIFMSKYFFHAKNHKNSKKWKKILQKFLCLSSFYSKYVIFTIYLNNFIIIIFLSFF